MAYYAPPPPYGGTSSIQGQLLEINVVGCKNLNDKEWFSRQDPYVCIEYGTLRHRTRTDTDGGKNPSFNEKFMVPLIEGLREINASVWNSNSLTYDDHIGSTRILIEKAISSGYDDTAWPLKSKNGKFAGELRLIMHYSNASKPGKIPGVNAQVAPAPSVCSGHAPGYPPQQGYSSQQGYPPQQQGYPPQQQGFPPQQGYPPQQPAPGAYPPPQPGYPPSQYSAPGPSSQGYPPAGYPPSSQPTYPPTPASYPAPGAYPSAPAPYPPGPGYMPQPPAYSQGYAPFGVAPYLVGGAAAGLGMGMGAYGLHGQFKHKHGKHKHGKWGKVKYGKFKWK